MTPLPNSECQSQAQLVTSTPDPLAVNVSTTPFLGSISFLEQLKGPRKTCYLLGHQFNVKTYN